MTYLNNRIKVHECQEDYWQKKASINNILFLHSISIKLSLLGYICDIITYVTFKSNLDIEDKSEK